MARDVLTLVQENMGAFSKGQKRIGFFLLENYEKAAYMTAGKLGEAAQVSESTVVRFASELGYDGYPAMQKAMQEMIRSKLTAAQRLEVSNDRIGDDELLSRMMRSDMEKIRLTMEEVNREEFNRTVEAIVNARRIYILGVRSALAIVSFMGFYFNLIFENVVLVHSTSVSEMFEQMFRVGKGDVVIGVSFPRYSRRTVQAMEYARSRGAAVVAITDCQDSPLYAISHHALLARSDMASFADSLVAPLSLVNALIAAVGRKKRGDLSETFERLEQIWDKYGVYEKDGEDGA